VAFLAAFVLGAVIGIVVMIVTGGGRKTRIAFGPFLAAGAVLSVLWGGPLAQALFHRGG
jgi:prepilin signal peptidase PulO-like enzyme (type II secretory pathway)